MLNKYNKLEFLNEYDNVFEVFDKNDSGNISFGVQKGLEKFFVKYAGYKTSNYSGDINSAINVLKNAKNNYSVLKCETLVKMINTFETSQGFGIVFEWFNGENLFPHWTFDEIDRYSDPRSPYYKFRQLDLKYKYQVIDKIFEFLIFVNNSGYIAVDFYDGSLMYNFESHCLKICDIDLFKSTKHIINLEGESYWGSSRIKSPEENKVGSIIDVRSNVYNLGKIIQCLVGNEFNPNLEDWELSKRKYLIVEKSLNENPNKRYDSVEEFHYFWKNSN